MSPLFAPLMDFETVSRNPPGELPEGEDCVFRRPPVVIKEHEHSYRDWMKSQVRHPPFDEQRCEGEVACARAVCVMYVACSAITVRVRPGSGVQRSAITVRVRKETAAQREDSES